MAYIKVGLNLSPSQITKIQKALLLKKPITVRLSKKQLSGSHFVHLTMSQVKKIEKAKAMKTGVDIYFSSTQLKANAKVGSGLFGSIGNLAKSGLNRVGHIAVDGAASLAKGAIDGMTGGCVACGQCNGSGFWSDLGKSVLKSAVSTVGDVAVDAGTNALNGLAKTALKKVTGNGKRKKKQTAKGLYPAGY